MLHKVSVAAREKLLEDDLLKKAIIQAGLDCHNQTNAGLLNAIKDCASTIKRKDWPSDADRNETDDDDADADDPDI